MTGKAWQNAQIQAQDGFALVLKKQTDYSACLQHAISQGRGFVEATKSRSSFAAMAALRSSLGAPRLNFARNQASLVETLAAVTFVLEVAFPTATSGQRSNSTHFRICAANCSSAAF